MEKLIKLNEHDILQALADHFDVDCAKVSLKIEKQWEGYGPTEHQALKISATIKEA